MPTGYTADVQDGKITEFKDFALQCARAFGALIDMRDSPKDAPLPAKIKPHTSYHDKALAEATERLAALRAMTPAKAVCEAMKSAATLLSAYEDSVTENKARRARYDAMLAKVRAWEPPTKDHTSLKKFMIEQLSESIKFDCYEPTKPKTPTTSEWLAAEIERVENSVEYHTKAKAEEVERATERDAWLQDLRKSLSA